MVDEDGDDPVVVARAGLVAGGVAQPVRSGHDVRRGAVEDVAGERGGAAGRRGVGGVLDAVGAQHQRDDGGEARQAAEQHPDRARQAGYAGCPGGAVPARAPPSSEDTHGPTVGPIRSVRDV